MAAGASRRDPDPDPRLVCRPAHGLDRPDGRRAAPDPHDAARLGHRQGPGPGGGGGPPPRRRRRSGHRQGVRRRRRGHLRHLLPAQRARGVRGALRHRRWRAVQANRRSAVAVRGSGRARCVAGGVRADVGTHRVHRGARALAGRPARGRGPPGGRLRGGLLRSRAARPDRPDGAGDAGPVGGRHPARIRPRLGSGGPCNRPASDSDRDRPWDRRTRPGGTHPSRGKGRGCRAHRHAQLHARAPRDGVHFATGVPQRCRPRAAHAIDHHPRPPGAAGR
jgi:hypothetical protein